MGIVAVGNGEGGGGIFVAYPLHLVGRIYSIGKLLWVVFFWGIWIEIIIFFAYVTFVPVFDTIL